jgi:hypothetical protein
MYSRAEEEFGKNRSVQFFDGNGGIGKTSF